MQGFRYLDLSLVDLQQISANHDCLYSVTLSLRRRDAIFEVRYVNNTPPYSRIEAPGNEINDFLRLRSSVSDACGGRPSGEHQKNMGSVVGYLTIARIYQDQLYNIARKHMKDLGLDEVTVPEIVFSDPFGLSVEKARPVKIDKGLVIRN